MKFLRSTNTRLSSDAIGRALDLWSRGHGAEHWCAVTLAKLFTCLGLRNQALCLMLVFRKFSSYIWYKSEWLQKLISFSFPCSLLYSWDVKVDLAENNGSLSPVYD